MSRSNLDESVVAVSEDGSDVVPINWLDDSSFAEILSGKCEMLRDQAAVDLDPGVWPVRLRAGEAIDAAVLPGPCLRVCRHYFRGKGLTCTELTSPLVLSNRACAVCKAKTDHEEWPMILESKPTIRFSLPVR